MKRTERRGELVAALRRVARDQGLAQANVRAVAAEAEMSVGSVLYYFENFEQLQLAAVEGVLEEFYERRRAITLREPDPVARLRALIEAGVPDEISGDLRIVYESIGLLREKPSYKPLHRSIVERQVMLYRSTIEIGVALGAFRPRQELSMVARNIVALEDAYDLYPLVGVDLDRGECRGAVIGYAELALDCDLG
ncbi:TetR/AcrR family transcriptional regulator [Agromyces archimandritae]|uniref:TetR/AcrR family transcriptional regulator n=1 Tax=Agromyces archimandritae TaxID=2781962 RepID=UPI001FD057FC|nr:TetR family transcriptional regulator [Agromyces archimandritae]